MRATVRLLSTMLMSLVGRPTGCAQHNPVWANAGLLSLLGLLAGAVAVAAGAPWPFGPPMPWLPATTAAAGLVAAAVLGRLFVPDQWHSHCQVCGACSIATGIPAARTEQNLIHALEAAGWQITGEPDDRCPRHRQVHAGSPTHTAAGHPEDL